MPQGQHRHLNPFLVVPCVSMAVGVFILDITPPREIAGSMLFVGVVLVSLLSMNRAFMIAIAAVCSALTLVIVFVSLGDESSLVSLVNHVLAIFTIFVTAIIGVKLANSRDRVREIGENARRILGASPVGMLLVDGNGRVTMANRAVERLFGHDQKGLLAMRAEDLVSPEDRDRFLEAQMGRETMAGREISGLHRNGTVIPLEKGLTPLAGEEGKTTLVTLIDIGERKRIEEQKRVEEVKRRMVEDLKRSNRDLDDFAYIASHDLKEPLRGINNYAIILQEDHGDRLNDDGRTKLETISRLCRRMENLINSLLEYSRMGRIDLAFGLVNLEEVVDKVIDSIHVTLEEARIEVRRPRPLPVIRCDEVLVAEIFRNLLVNASKYNDNPEKWIEIGWDESEESKLRRSMRGGRKDGSQTVELVFHVGDNGIGIPEKHLETVFGIFKRLHGREKYGGGTGAGLTIVKKIVEKHGGRIWVESVPGDGATFYFTLNQCQGIQKRSRMAG